MERMGRKTAMLGAALAMAVLAGCHEVERVWPNPAPPVAEVTIAGSGFGAEQGAAEVFHDGLPLPVVSWSPDAIVTTLPDPKPNGTYVVEVVIHGVSESTYHSLIASP